VHCFLLLIEMVACWVSPVVGKHNPETTNKESPPFTTPVSFTFPNLWKLLVSLPVWFSLFSFLCRNHV
jgi:hypothetical protein